MKVKIAGLGVVEFPAEMSEENIKKALEKFKRIPQPVVVTETKIVEIEKPVIVKETEYIDKPMISYEPKVIEVERVLQRPQTGWHFKIERDEDGITDIYAEPYE